MWQEAQMLARFAAGLRRFLGERITAETARRTLENSLRNREAAFLALLKRAVFEAERSPYLWLFRRAGIQFEDLCRLVPEEGLEQTLERLLEAGVYLTIDEFKGRAPLRRGLEEFPMSPASCDNPIPAGHFPVSSGGSAGAGRRMVVDLDLLRYESACLLLFAQTAGILGARCALWRPVPPGSAGIKRALSWAQLGLPFERWFTTQPYHPLVPRSKSWAVTTIALAASRMAGKPIPSPEYVGLSEAGRVARWMADLRRQGLTPHLDTSVSTAILAARAAQQEGLDISGAFVRVGGEPLTPGRAALLRKEGCRFAAHYAIAESGPVGIACSDPAAADDAHLLEGKMAAVMRAGVPGMRCPDGIAPLYLTTLLAASPKIMINVESGDTAVMERRACSCLFGEMGLQTHLHSIRSYEKLTAGGMHFLGSTLIRLVEEILPGRFGGDPTDYQFVESDSCGLAGVRLRIHPRLSGVDEARVLETVFAELARGGAADRMMAEQWRQGGVLKTERTAPQATAAAKILPLRIRDTE